MKYQELMKVIRGGAFKPVYLFTGPETHIARMMENNLIKQVIPAGLEQINVMTFEEKDTAVEDVTGICRQLPMMSPYRVVILREETGMLHSSDKTVMDELGDYIAHPELTTVLILWDVKADKRKKWYKALKKTGDIVEYDKLREEDLGKWIGRRLQLAGKKTTQRVVNPVCGAQPVPPQRDGQHGHGGQRAEQAGGLHRRPGDHHPGGPGGDHAGIGGLTTSSAWWTTRSGVRWARP